MELLASAQQVAEVTVYRDFFSPDIHSRLSAFPCASSVSPVVKVVKVFGPHTSAKIG